METVSTYSFFMPWLITYGYHIWYAQPCGMSHGMLKPCSMHTHVTWYAQPCGMHTYVIWYAQPCCTHTHVMWYAQPCGMPFIYVIYHFHPFHFMALSFSMENN